MNYDSTAPQKLITIQNWFASFIRQPLTKEDSHPEEKIHPSIQSTHALSAFERMELYSQSYWLRLRGIILEDFPLVARLFGEHDFYHKLAMPYLLKYPPTSWDIHRISESFVHWLEENYRDDDRELILHAANLDSAYLKAFYAKKQTSTLENLEKMVQEKNILQPHIQLLTFPFHLPEWRQAFVQKECNYWVEHDFPPLHKDKAPYFFVIFRNPKLMIEWKEQSLAAFTTLSLLKEGKSIEEVCQLIETYDETIREDAEQNIAFWMQEWSFLGWFT